MSDESAVLFERLGPVATLTLNRPTVGNAINVSMARNLLEAAIVCDADDAIRCVLLTGAGRLFCTGGDVTSFAAAGDSVGSVVREITAYLHMAIARFAHMGKPLVTAINGPAAGAGFGLSLLGDLVLAAHSAYFTLAYTAIGLTPDAGSTWLLPRLVGLRRAQELVLTNRRIPAAEALSLGLVTRLVDDAALVADSRALAGEVACAATGAFAQSRRLLLSSYESSLETQLEAEARAIVEAVDTPHGKEGIRAFLAKVKPNFSL